MASENLLLVEKSLLRGKWDEKISRSSAIDLAKSTVECRFRDVLKSRLALSLFRSSSNSLDRPLRDMLSLTTPPELDTFEGEIVRLAVAVACLHAFVQANWTGPDLDIQPMEILPNDSDTAVAWSADLLHSKAVSELAFGGEPAYHLSQVPAFFRFSQLLLALPYKHLNSVSWWRLRVASIHQQILDEPVALEEDFRETLQPLLRSVADEPGLAGRLHLEIGLLDHHLGRDRTAAEDFIKAARSTGLEYELTGALGKRTKFQVTELSQLVLLAESRLTDTLPANPSGQENAESNDVDATDHSDIKNIPETLYLNDDTLLEQTEFTSSQSPGSKASLGHIDPSNQPPLHPLDQCILLSLCLNVRNTSPSHGLTTEQMTPYVSRVILHPRNWSVHTMALLLRSRLESSRTRTVERSTFQLQALIDQMPTSDSTTAERLLYFHSIPLPSKWEMEKELSQRFLSLGVIKSALEILERLEMWEDVVKCYEALEKPEKGITIVRDLLEGKKAEVDVVVSRGKSTSIQHKKTEDATRNAKLWCLLGDLEPVNAIDHYQHAWKISNETSGRAMRSLGGYYFAHAKYQDAVDCLRKAVKINPLLARSWFVLGCACMRMESWEEAKNAFSRCVAIDEEDGESWNNLASMYLRMGGSKTRPPGAIDIDESKTTSAIGQTSQVEGPSDSVPFENKMLAFRALKQGLRYSYENWRMWFNYMIISMDVGELQEACRALGRIVEQTGDKVGSLAVDEDVLDRLVDAVTRAPPKVEDALAENEAAAQNPNEGHGLYRNLLSLFERTLLSRLSAPRVFRAYARLLSWQNKWEDALKAYLDAYRCSPAAAIEKGETDTEKWRAAVSEVEEIVDVLRNFGPRVEGYKWRLQGRSIVRTFMGRTKDFEEEPEWETLKALQDELKKDEA